MEQALWSISVTYIISYHGLGGFSELINGLVAAAIGALYTAVRAHRKKKVM